MAKKDKFAQMQQGGGVGSFQETLVQAATTVAAIERRQEEAVNKAAVLTVKPVATREQGGDWQAIEQPKFMRLPNPQIPFDEYDMVSRYCSNLPNMTRQDFVELAIVEKLHSIGHITDEQFHARHDEIRNRPPRGMRKGTKTTHTSK